MANRLIDNLMMKNDKISDLKNDTRYVRYEDIPVIIADIVNAEYIEAQNARLSQAQIDQLDAGDIHVSGTIHAQDGYIGGAKIKDGLIEIKNINIAENIEANHINVQSIAAVEAFIQALTVVKMDAKFTDRDVEDQPFECSTIVLGNMLTKKYPCYQTTDESGVDHYVIVIEVFYFNNHKWLRCVQCDGVAGSTVFGLYLKNPSMYICDESMFDYPGNNYKKYSWSKVFI